MSNTSIQILYQKKNTACHPVSHKDRAQGNQVTRQGTKKIKIKKRKKEKALKFQRASPKVFVVKRGDFLPS